MQANDTIMGAWQSLVYRGGLVLDVLQITDV